VQPLVDAIIGLTGRIIEAISIVWEYISPFVGWIAEVLIAGLSNAFQTLWTIFEYIFSLIANAVTTIINVFSGLIDFVIGIFTGDWDRAWSGIKKIFTSIWDGIKTSVQIAINFISNIITTVLNKIKTTVTTILDGIKLVFTKIFDAIKARVELVIGLIKSIVLGVMTIMHDGIDGTLNKIKKVFVNIFTSIKNSVTDLFTKLWSNIKGTINSILGGIEGMANGVVRGVNRVIGALNNLSFDIPDWIPGLGGKTFGFSIPTLSEINIPKLAQGGFVKANTPQLAMIGDNRHQGEVVAPEDKLLEMALKAAKLASQGNQNSQTADLLAMTVELLKQILNALFGLNLSAEVDGRTLLTILTNEQNRSGFDLIT
jgi:phage-related protein